MLSGEVSGEDPWIGKIIGDRYRIISQLGRGGMGHIYLAEQQMGTATRKVAIKTLQPELASDPITARRFNREAELVTRLSHPNTITFYDFGQSHDGALYIVMEYIKGESLASVLKQGAVEPQRVLQIIEQICASLHEAHEMGIIHRDLKPENVILTQRVSQADFVKVLDFGIAKRTELDADSLKLTRAGVVLGTPPYMSPEQFAGQALDRRSDIYSLGVMTYEMLTGVLPFSAKTPWEWATQHLSVPPRSFDDVDKNAHISRARRQAILRALAKVPEDRPPTTLAFFERLGATTPDALEHTSSIPTASHSNPRSSSQQALPLENPRSNSSAPLPNTQKVPRVSVKKRSSWWLAPLILLLAVILGVGAVVIAHLLGLLPPPFWLESLNWAE